MPEVKKLSSGWLHIRVSSECWAQIPWSHTGPIPDEYIFQPSWNRDRINQFWSQYDAT